MILFTGPEAHEALFRQPDEVLSPNAAYKMMVPVFGEGVAYGAEPAKMAEQMHMLYPALRNNRMRTYTEIVARETLDTIADWGERGEFEASEFFGMLTNYTHHQNRNFSRISKSHFIAPVHYSMGKRSPVRLKHYFKPGGLHCYLSLGSRCSATPSAINATP